MDPSIIAPPDAQVPKVDMAQLGDPLSKLGLASNGMGTGGGIGTGANRNDDGIGHSAIFACDRAADAD